MQWFQSFSSFAIETQWSKIIFLVYGHDWRMVSPQKIPFPSLKERLELEWEKKLNVETEDTLFIKLLNCEIRRD